MKIIKKSDMSQRRLQFLLSKGATIKEYKVQSEPYLMIWYPLTSKGETHD